MTAGHEGGARTVLGVMFISLLLSYGSVATPCQETWEIPPRSLGSQKHRLLAKRLKCSVCILWECLNESVAHCADASSSARPWPGCAPESMKAALPAVLPQNCGHK